MTKTTDKKAINLYDKKEYDVELYEKDNKSVMYIDTQNGAVSYIILEESEELIENVIEGYKYSYYTIDGILYNSFYTNDYKCFAKSKRKQMRLF